jgi:hypothetical protein
MSPAQVAAELSRRVAFKFSTIYVDMRTATGTLHITHTSRDLPKRNLSSLNAQNDTFDKNIGHSGHRCSATYPES